MLLQVSRSDRYARE